jgi:hypothetical protein
VVAGERELMTVRGDGKFTATRRKSKKRFAILRIDPKETVKLRLSSGGDG